MGKSTGNNTAKNSNDAKKIVEQAREYLGKQEKKPNLPINDFEYSEQFIKELTNIGVLIPEDKTGQVISLFKKSAFILSRDEEYLLDIEDEYFNLGESF